MVDTRTEQELLEEFFEGPMSDIMTRDEWLLKIGRGDLVKGKDERKKGKTKIKKQKKSTKHIMELKTNVPRLIKFNK